MDELLKLFEEGNKIVYRTLISLRHKIRREDEDVVYDAFRSFYLANQSLFAVKDVGLFKLSPFYYECELIWSELSPANRFLVWKWIDCITQF